jgi:hypothetical protein
LSCVPWAGDLIQIPATIVNPGNGLETNVIFELDTGAQISLMPQSVKQILQLGAGTPIQMVGVGGSPFNVEVFNLKVNFGGIAYTIPVAIAASEDVPFLLGREGFFSEISSFTVGGGQACIGTATAAPTFWPLAVVLGGVAVVAVILVLKSKKMIL